MNDKIYEYDAVVEATESGGGGAYVRFPYDIRAEFGKGRVKVHATFDGEPYDGSVVNMGVKNEDGSVCYVIGILKEIRTKINKQPGDTVRVTIREAGTVASADTVTKTVVVPEELASVMETDAEAKTFFESLTDGYKRGYCDWVGGAKQIATRQTRADKALSMLQKKQKTLKT